MKGDIARVSILQDWRDSDDSIYFAEHSAEKAGEIEIKRFDPSDTSIGVLLTLKAPKILAFKQLKDFTFIIIDDQGSIKLYELNAKGDRLEHRGNLYTQEEDKQFIVKNFGDYEEILLDKEALVVKSRVIYLHESPQQVVEGILTSQDVKKEMRSDFEYQIIKEPVDVRGQYQFIAVFSYKDSGSINYFQFRQRKYLLPNCYSKALINDFNHSCNFSTFLTDRSILGCFGHKFLKFDEFGRPYDLVEFHGHPQHTSG